MAYVAGYKCDQCGKVELGDERFFISDHPLPKGWFRAMVSDGCNDPASRESRASAFCSVGCLTKWAEIQDELLREPPR